MKKQSKWPFMVFSGLLAVSVAGFSLADDDWRGGHHGMMNQNKDDHVWGENNYRWHEGDRDAHHRSIRHHGDEDHHGQGMCRGKDSWWTNLSNDQQASAKKIWLEHQKHTAESRARLRVAKAELDLLSMEDDPDQSRVDAKVDEITQFINQLIKQRYALRLEMRALLDDEQRAAYDAARSPRADRHDFRWHH